mmetsp:Transcript_3599/g.10610  ORF Transcript_3599/g.10610 Transcript_3599/m.10610 type:complete len:434 (+) Transcript_3599:216-1517(+)
MPTMMMQGGIIAQAPFDNLHAFAPNHDLDEYLSTADLTYISREQLRCQESNLFAKQDALYNGHHSFGTDACQGQQLKSHGPVDFYRSAHSDSTAFGNQLPAKCSDYSHGVDINACNRTSATQSLYFNGQNDQHASISKNSVANGQVAGGEFPRFDSEHHSTHFDFDRNMVVHSARSQEFRSTNADRSRGQGSLLAEPSIQESSATTSWNFPSVESSQDPSRSAQDAGKESEVKMLDYYREAIAVLVQQNTELRQKLAKMEERMNAMQAGVVAADPKLAADQTSSSAAWAGLKPVVASSSSPAMWGGRGPAEAKPAAQPQQQQQQQQPASFDMREEDDECGLCEEEEEPAASSAEGRKSGRAKSRFWTRLEHTRFLEGLKLYGGQDAHAIAAHVGTRTATQVRTHAQKYFIKLAKVRAGKGLPRPARSLHDLDV